MLGDSGEVNVKARLPMPVTCELKSAQRDGSASYAASARYMGGHLLLMLSINVMQQP